MTEWNRKRLAARRLALLGSVAVLGAGLMFSGPLGYGPFAEHAIAAPVSAAQQGPTGFADLISKVKPAVISVRVRVDQGAEQSALGSDEDQQPNFKGTPFERFFHQYGFENGPRGEMQQQRHQMVTGVGSGFFISADGYAVTNNHVVDHAKSVQITTDDGKTSPPR